LFNLILGCFVVTVIISYVSFAVINGQRRKDGGTIAFIEEL